jgi:hypothetical protein
MAGVAQRNKLPGALPLFWGPAKQDFSKLGVSKKQLIAARIRLQTNCRRFGLEGSQDHIKLLHIASAVLGAQKENPQEEIWFRGIRDFSST